MSDGLAVMEHLVAWVATKSKTTGYNLRERVAGGSTMFVGEGNLSFSLAIGRLEPKSARDFVTTTFESKTSWSDIAARNAFQLGRLGARVMHGVDATALDRHIGRTKFDLIVFNFPNVASRTPIYGRNPNHNLVRKFLRSGVRHLNPRGEIVVTTVENPFYRGAFDFSSAAKFAGVGQPEVHPFVPTEYPGYNHTNTIGDGSALGRHDKFQAWVFRAL